MAGVERLQYGRLLRSGLIAQMRQVPGLARALVSVAPNDADRVSIQIAPGTKAYAQMMRRAGFHGVNRDIAAAVRKVVADRGGLTESEINSLEANRRIPFIQINHAEAPGGKPLIKVVVPPNIVNQTLLMRNIARVNAEHVASQGARRAAENEARRSKALAAAREHDALALRRRRH